MDSPYLPGKASGPSGVAARQARELDSPAESQAAREARIAELRRQYLAGTYEVDANLLSANIIEQHRKGSKPNDRNLRD
jgi:anti-sigma28 factor (negative regulator of flagellin synthesis)